MTINCGNDQLRRLLQPQQRFVRVQTEIILEFGSHTAKHLNVGAGAKEFSPAAGDDNDLNAFIHPRFENARIELLHHLIRISIRRWIVQSDDRYATLDSVFNQRSFCHQHSCLSEHVTEPRAVATGLFGSDHYN